MAKTILEYKPWPGFQEEFIYSTADYRLLGGEAGPGKSFILIWDSQFDYDVPPGSPPKKMWEVYNYTSLIVRKERTQMEKLKMIATPYLEALGYRWYGNPDNFYCRKESNAKVHFGSLQYDDSYMKYQGWSIHDLRIDEITQFHRQALVQLMGWARADTPGVRSRISATANPDGPGLDWVKQYWHINCPCDNPEHQGKNRLFYKDGNENIVDKDAPGLKTSWHFISCSRKGSYFEKMEKDTGTVGRYENSLMTLHGGKDSPGFRAYGKGCWEVAKSSLFPELDKDVHLVPDNWLPARFNWFGLGGHDWASSPIGDAAAFVRLLVNENKDVIVDDIELVWGCGVVQQAQIFAPIHRVCKVCVSGPDIFARNQGGESKSVADQFRSEPEDAPIIFNAAEFDTKTISSMLRSGLRAAIEGQQGAIFIRNRCRRVFDDIQYLQADPKQNYEGWIDGRTVIEWKGKKGQYHKDGLSAFFAALSWVWRNDVSDLVEKVPGSTRRQENIEKLTKSQEEVCSVAYEL
jgi:hypothetical protein